MLKFSTIFPFSDLCTLILVEGIDLEWIQSNEDNPEQ